MVRLLTWTKFRTGKIPHLPLKNEGEIPHLPLKNEGKIPHLPLKNEGKIPHLPLKNEGKIPHLPLKNEGKIPHLPLKNEGKIPHLPLKNEGKIPHLPLKNEGKIPHLPLKNEGKIPHLPLKNEGEIPHLPLKNEGKIPHLPLKNEGEIPHQIEIRNFPRGKIPPRKSPPPCTRPPAPPKLSRNVPRPACGSVGPCSIGSCLGWQVLAASLCWSGVGRPTQKPRWRQKTLSPPNQKQRRTSGLPQKFPPQRPNTPPQPQKPHTTTTQSPALPSEGPSMDAIQRAWQGTSQWCGANHHGRVGARVRRRCAGRALRGRP